MKTCFKCSKALPISEFYKHPKMADGHLSKCKTCTRKDSSDRYGVKKLDPKWLAKERERCRRKMDRYREEGRAVINRSHQRNWAARNQVKVRASLIANRAVKKGVLIKPPKCAQCETQTCRLEKHHPDYSQPLMVQWLCTTCHGITRRKDSFSV